jgi:hypothetical protein
MSSPAFREIERTGVQRGYEVPGTTSIVTSDLVFFKPDLESVINRIEEVILRPLLVATSREEFRGRRNVLFPRYASLSSGLREMLTENGEGEHNGSKEDFFGYLYSLVRNSHIISWPDGGQDEAIFCIETLERAQWMVTELNGRQVLDASDQERDRTLAYEYGCSAFWSQMHIDCLVAVLMRRVLTLPSPDILLELLEGMRLSVIAYSSAKQGYDLRHISDYEALPDDPEDADALACTSSGTLALSGGAVVG